MLLRVSFEVPIRGYNTDQDRPPRNPLNLKMRVFTNLSSRLALSTCLAAGLGFAGTAHGTGSGGAIPTGAFVTAGTVTSDIVLSDSGVVANGNAVTVNLLGLQHDFAGDLQITLSYIDSKSSVVQSVDILNRIGSTTANPYGTSADFGNNQGAGDNYQFNTDYAGNIWATAACSDPPACTTPYGDADSIPGVSTDTINNGQYFTSTVGGAKTQLSYAFTGLSVSGGTWRLTVTDAADPNVGSYIGWEIFINTIPGVIGNPAMLTVVSGTPQTAMAGSSFGNALQVKVTDASANPVSGVIVTFSAPGSGASATFGGASTITAVTDANGVGTSLIPVANATVGSYSVSASVSGLTPVTFSLTNTPVVVTGSATFEATDATTLGNWTGKYGADGQLIPNGLQNPARYATVNFSGNSTYTFAATTYDPRALQSASGSSTRIASVYYSPTVFTIDVNLTDGNTHQVSLYLCDWNSYSRTETVTIVDASSLNVLSMRPYSSFNGGVWEIYQIKGHVQIQITRTGGDNGCSERHLFRSGAFLTVASSASYSGADAATVRHLDGQVWRGRAVDSEWPAGPCPVCDGQLQR